MSTTTWTIICAIMMVISIICFGYAIGLLHSLKIKYPNKNNVKRVCKNCKSYRITDYLIYSGRLEGVCMKTYNELKKVALIPENQTCGRWEISDELSLEGVKAKLERCVK